MLILKGWLFDKMCIYLCFGAVMFSLLTLSASSLIHGCMQCGIFLLPVARMGEGRGVHRVVVGKLEGKRPLGRPRRRWEDNIKMDIQEVGGGCGDWMELAWDRERWRALVSSVMTFGFHKMRRISWPAAEPVSFSRRTLLHGVNK